MNGRDHKGLDDYGPHKYADHDGTSDCAHACTCFMGPSNSGGPLGIDPFGHCPNNPKDGKRQPGNNDYEDVVNGRIDTLKAQVSAANEELIAVEPSKRELAAELRQANTQLAELECFISNLGREFKNREKFIRKTWKKREALRIKSVASRTKRKN